MEDVLAPVEKTCRSSTKPPAGPAGGEGRETDSATPEEIVTVIDGDAAEMIDGCRAHRASALTRVYVPAAFQVLEALAPAVNHGETLPSDQENRYSIEWPELETAPPVE